MRTHTQENNTNSIDSAHIGVRSAINNNIKVILLYIHMLPPMLFTKINADIKQGPRCIGLPAFT